jgi:hypothetical protein
MGQPVAAPLAPGLAVRYQHGAVAADATLVLGPKGQANGGKRPGSIAALAWGCYQLGKGQTVAQYVTACTAACPQRSGMVALRWDLAHGLVALGPVAPK